MDVQASSKVQLIDPMPTSLVAAMYDQPDYRDAFLVPIPQKNLDSVAAFATAFFSGQSRFIAAISMNLRSKEAVRIAIGDESYAQGSAVGSWRVHARDEREIVFGDDMGFMEYRFSFLLRDDKQIEASTAVKYKSARLGPIYFAVVKPFHRWFVAIALRHSAAAATAEDIRPATS